MYIVHTKIIPGGAAANSDSISVTSMETETATDFTTKEITIIAESWTQSQQELAELLSVSGESSNYKILEKWLKEQEGDKRRKLPEKFEENEYPNMATLIYYDLP